MLLMRLKFGEPFVGLGDLSYGLCDLFNEHGCVALRQLEVELQQTLGLLEQLVLITLVRHFNNIQNQY